MIALLDGLGIEACWLVGTSSGGYLAQQIALDHSTRVRGMVLVGSPRSLRQTLPPLFTDTLSSLADPVTREDVARINGALPLHAPVSGAFIEDQTTAALTIPTHVWQATMEGLLDAVPPTERGQLEVPTLILWGGAEDVLPAHQGRELEAAIRASRLLTYEGTGHLVLWEQPERVAQDIASFITGSPD